MPENKEIDINAQENVCETRTHKYTPKCGIELYVTTRVDNSKIKDITVGKSGSCKSIMWEVMGRLLNEIPPEKIVQIMSNYTCEHGGLGGQSCFDKLARIYRPSTKEAK